MDDGYRRNTIIFWSWTQTPLKQRDLSPDQIACKVTSWSTSHLATIHQHFQYKKKLTNHEVYSLSNMSTGILQLWDFQKNRNYNLHPRVSYEGKYFYSTSILIYLSCGQLSASHNLLCVQVVCLANKTQHIKLHVNATVLAVHHPPPTWS